MHSPIIPVQSYIDHSDLFRRAPPLCLGYRGILTMQSDEFGVYFYTTEACMIIILFHTCICINLTVLLFEMHNLKLTSRLTFLRRSRG